MCAAAYIKLNFPHRWCPPSYKPPDLLRRNEIPYKTRTFPWEQFYLSQHFLGGGTSVQSSTVQCGDNNKGDLLVALAGSY